MRYVVAAGHNFVCRCCVLRDVPSYCCAIFCSYSFTFGSCSIVADILVARMAVADFYDGIGPYVEVYTSCSIAIYRVVLFRLGSYADSLGNKVLEE